MYIRYSMQPSLPINRVISERRGGPREGRH